ncbi:hypothetical protein D3C75_673860 [compost metagenome]
MIVEHIRILSDILREGSRAALPLEIMPALLQPPVFHRFDRSIEKIIGIIHHFPIRLHRQLCASTVVEQLFHPVAIFGFTGILQQVVAEFEDCPGTAGYLAAAPGVIAGDFRTAEIRIGQAGQGGIPGRFQ